MFYIKTELNEVFEISKTPLKRLEMRFKFFVRGAAPVAKLCSGSFLWVIHTAIEGLVVYLSCIYLYTTT